MIDTELLTQLARQVALRGFGAGAGAALREDFPELRLDFCLEDEIGTTEPYREYADFNLYLVSGGGGGCKTLTDSPQHAQGVLIAEVGDP